MPAGRDRLVATQYPGMAFADQLVQQTERCATGAFGLAGSRQQCVGTSFAGFHQGNGRLESLVGLCQLRRHALPGAEIAKTLLPLLLRPVLDPLPQLGPRRMVAIGTAAQRVIAKLLVQHIVGLDQRAGRLVLHMLDVGDHRRRGLRQAHEHRPEAIH